MTLVQVVVVVVALALVVGLTWLVASSRLGRAMRAIAENPTAARVLGINGVR